MLNRVLLDANAVLNAAFIPESWSRLVVSKLVQQRKALFVGSWSLREAVGSARRVAADLGKKTDPAPVIDQFIRHVGAIEVPPSEDAIEPAVPAHDQHVAREAITAKATIFTSDAKLWAGCNAVGRTTVLPLQALRHLDGMSIATTVFGVAPGRHTGSVFARVYPGGWAPLNNVGQFTVADFFGRLWLHYCTQSRAWVAEMPEVGRVTVAVELATDAMQVVAVSWEAGKGLRLRVGGVEAPAEAAMRDPLQAALVGNVSIGHRANSEHHWNGAINVCVMNDRPIGVKLWGALRTSVELTPNPYDSDRLRLAINHAIV